MKKHIYSKLVDDITVGHLYEHIFADALTQNLRENGYFSYVDYYLDAKNYHNGVVVIGINTFNEKTDAYIESLMATPLEINSDSVDGAFLQIMAEYTSDVTYIESDSMNARLKSYAKLEWQKGRVEPPDNWELLEPSIEYVEVPGVNFGIIEQRISIHVSDLDEELRPLYLIVSKALRNNLMEDISANSFCYTYEDSLTVGDDSLVDTNLYRVDKRQASGITIEIEVADALVAGVLKNGFAERLSDSLARAKPGTQDFPDSKEIQDKLGVTVSDDIWKRTASSENIRKIIDSLDISFTFVE